MKNGMKLSKNDPRIVEKNPRADVPDVGAVRFEAEVMVWQFADGRAASAPLSHWPTLWLATRAERETFQINRGAVYWPLLDADIASEHILSGAREHRALARKAWEHWMQREYASQAA